MNKLKQAFSNRSNKSNESSSTKRTPKATASLQPQPYHHIPLGSGGVLSREALGDFQKPATFVGATATLNTVGIFFEISDSKCFIAHIDAHVTRPSSAGRAQKHYSTNYKTTALLREALTARLDAAVPEDRTKRMRDTLLITCARLSGQEPRTADAVVKTVREWLGAEISGGGRVAEARSGFVAGWPAAARVLFEQAPAEGWRAAECDIGAGAWSIGVEEAELEPSDEAW
jgi:hypothetical protein